MMHGNTKLKFCEKTSCDTIIKNSVHENPPADFQLTGRNVSI